MKKIKILALIGESGAGKDTVLNSILNKTDWNRIIKYTTRPKRQNEVDGIDYHFVTKQEFMNTSVIGISTFRSWNYGIAKSSLKRDNINIGIFDPSGIKDIVNDSNIDLQVIYITAKPKVRLLRSLNREDNPDINEIVRRYLADSEDFKSLNGISYRLYYNELENETSSLANLIIADTRAWANATN